MRLRSTILLGLGAGALALTAMVAPALASTGSPFGNGAWPSMVKYYTINDGTNFLRSTKPFKTGIATQRHTADAMTVGTANTSGYADSGFVVYDGKLADISGFTLKGTGSQFGFNLWFDTNHDGEFFGWDDGVFTGVGGDTYGLGSASVDGVLAVTGDSTFYMMTAPYTSPTLDQLKAGAFPGIDGNTHVTLWIGVNGATPQSTTILPPKSK